MLLTFAQPVNMTWRGYDLKGAAGTVFRLPDALATFVTSELTRTASNSAGALTPTFTVTDEANSGSIHYEIVLQQASAAHTYTATLPIPAGATIKDILIRPTALWDNATSALLNVGDTFAATAYFNQVNLKTLTADTNGSGVGDGSIKQGLLSTTGSSSPIGGLSTVLAQPTGAGRRYVAANTLTATLVTVGAGTVGTTSLLVDIVPAPVPVTVVIS